MCVLKWKAPALEIQAFEKNGTWILILLPLRKRIAWCKWIFSVKHKADGSVKRYKAHLIVRGFTHSYEID